MSYLKKIHHLTDAKGRTPLILACMEGDLPMVKEMLKIETVQLDQQSADRGMTALMYSIEAQHPVMAELLINHGADLHLQDDTGRNALDWATEMGLDTLAELIQILQHPHVTRL